MIAVIFEVWPAEGRKDDYLNIAHELRAELDRIDGFLSVERFESIYEPGKYNEVEDVTPKWSTAGGQVLLGALSVGTIGPVIGQLIAAQTAAISSSAWKVTTP